ncbi:uncharacterized protein LOC141608356 [Silene latifolia]|uniref:uncharacterized protein LOC141608356 n=1 Tax=Silene latifolia TaxID=37657 RepID=UPI003D7849C3
MYDPIILKVQHLVGSCAVKFLSYAGKTEVLNSMVYGLENFWCGSLLLPQNVCATITKLCKQLFWGYQEGQRKLIFKDWASICSPWSEGGFQIKNLAIWNQANMLKWLWHFVQGTGSIWTAWIRHYFLATNSIWDLQIHEYHSESLRNVLTARDIWVTHCGSKQKAIAMLLACTTKGKFFVGKAYNLLRPRFPAHACYRAVQDPFLMSRHKFTLMLALQRKLATADRFCRRGISIAKTVFAVKPKKHWRNKWFKCSIAAATYYIWMERNYRLFEGKERQAPCLIKDVKLCVHVLLLHKSPPTAHAEILEALNVYKISLSSLLFSSYACKNLM